MRLSPHLLPALAALVIASALPACKKAQDAAVESAIERATGSKVDIDKDGNSMTIKTEQGDVSITSAEDGGSVAMPAGFPTDIYLPEDHRVASAMDMAGMQMVNLVTRAGVSALSADVERHMQAGGWKREMAMQADGSSTLMYSKDKRQVVYQLVKAEDGETQLAIRTGESS